jgi:hypothetical protein
MEDNVRETLNEQPMQEKSWKPSRIEALRNHEINIRFLDRGVMVSVGCKQIAYESVETFKSAFNAYVDNPYDVQEAWRKYFQKES